MVVRIDFSPEQEKEIRDNIDRGLMPCGCERSKCKCKISNILYVMKYQRFMGSVIKHNTGFLRENKKRVAKEVGKNMKEAYRFLKDSKKADKE